MKRKNVYVIDYDLIGPLGLGKLQTYKSLQQNICAENTISKFNAKGLPVSRGAEVVDSLTSLYSNEPDSILSAIKYDRKMELLIASYHLMEERLKSIFSVVPAARSGVILGLGIDVPSFEKINHATPDLTNSKNDFTTLIKNINKDKGRVNTIFNSIDVHSIYLAEKLSLGAFQKTTLTACAASTQAIAFAYESIVNDEADIVLAGGTDSIINPVAFMSFSKLGVLAEVGKDGRSCRPFDLNRGGALAGEAAGLCVLASEEIVEKKGLTPLFRFLGYGNTLDAYKITSPDPSGGGIKRAIRSMLSNAELTPKDIDYINLHGTGTRNNDEVELNAFMEVMGTDLSGIPISSTKDRHGHAIAAAGIQEFVVLCESLRNNFIPCNLNLQKPIKQNGCDLVQNENRNKEMKTGVTVNFAFGGINTALAIKKV